MATDWDVLYDCIGQVRDEIGSLASVVGERNKREEAVFQAATAILAAHIRATGYTKLDELDHFVNESVLAAVLLVSKVYDGDKPGLKIDLARPHPDDVPETPVERIAGQTGQARDVP